MTTWAYQAGHLATAAAERSDWDRTFHWTRHADPSWNLASRAAGGYEAHSKKVQKWLGHARLSTTPDTYVHEPEAAVSAARSAHLPAHDSEWK